MLISQLIIIISTPFFLNLGVEQGEIMELSFTVAPTAVFAQSKRIVSPLTLHSAGSGYTIVLFLIFQF